MKTITHDVFFENQKKIPNNSQTDGHPHSSFLHPGTYCEVKVKTQTEQKVKMKAYHTWFDNMSMPGC